MQRRAHTFRSRRMDSKRGASPSRKGTWRRQHERVLHVQLHGGTHEDVLCAASISPAGSGDAQAAPCTLSGPATACPGFVTEMSRCHVYLALDVEIDRSSLDLQAITPCEHSFTNAYQYSKLSRCVGAAAPMRT